MKKIVPLLFVCSIGLVGCSLPGLGGAGSDSIRIGANTGSEPTILAHINRLMIEEYTDLQVTVIGNLGSSIVNHQAMLNNDIDMSSVRYTGTDVPGALGMDPVMDPEEAMSVVQEEFAERFDQKWYDSYGFTNTYAFAVTQEFADAEGLETVSDLEAIADDLDVGMDNSWINREGDGYEGFQDHYGFAFGETYPMQIGLVYDALASDSMDSVLAYTTDGRIAAYELKILEDDQRFFPPYDASVVVKNEVLEQHPELDDVFEKLVGKIDNDLMQRLNYEADGEMKEPATVAEEFLEANDYFRERGEGE
ncbi:osmoprotectant ABC transporter substrate-binding protein [Shouchella shacheensis]|uniref:osmoprotectant ABC transporter substrate-binding protein n=1 Tax=Shouchella shacheensis TaxID=1649580 RepID=UPI00074016A2|nr:osmoprotectant ABC transporter substrate-binding protein [Shouchella shacheensis]